MIATSTSRIGRKEGRRLTAAAILSVLGFLNVLYSAQTQQYFRRYLSINLGGGNCEWTAPVPFNATEKKATTTLLTSYPGSGKRLCWRVMEALSGHETGDDWDLSLRGLDTLFVKTTYPHPEGIWSWDDSMDQVILLIRNPRYAIPSYHTMRHEIDYSDGWDKSFSRTDWTYTMRPPIKVWEEWRDVRFDTEIDLWGWFIDFWMQNGLRRNNGSNNSTQDPHCKEDMKDCRPKTIIQFEKIIDSDESVMIQELEKIGIVLDASLNVPIIANEARPCVYRGVVGREEKHFHNSGRNKIGPTIDEKTFTYQQLNIMRSEVIKMKEKYTLPPFENMALAQNLVVILNEYIAELSNEYDTTFQDANNAVQPP